jgi:predicted RNA-binding Zn ribbon-like protein
MGERQEAPGELEQVRQFVNTVDLEQGIEQLSDPASLAGWLASQELAPKGLRPSVADLRRAVALREALRQVLLAHNGAAEVPADAAAALEAAAARSRVRLHFDNRARGRLEPEATGTDAALGRLLAIVHGAVADGSWERLKACREHTCEWAFYDQTRNHSRAWCDMQVCGNRAKARAYRQRHG